MPQRVRTHPEKKSPHCDIVRLLRTSHNGLVRSTFSLLGTRFRKKYGAIGENSTEEKGPKGKTKGGEGSQNPSRIETAALALKYRFQNSRLRVPLLSARVQIEGSYFRTWSRPQRYSFPTSGKMSYRPDPGNAGEESTLITPCNLQSRPELQIIVSRYRSPKHHVGFRRDRNIDR